MFELADIIARRGSQFLQEHPAYQRPEIIQAFQDIVNCRTEALGGHVYQCSETSCGRYVYAYHSCRNRHCPKCHADQTQAWVDQRRTELLPVPYYHIVFTVPSQLHTVILQNQRTLYAVLMQEAAAALKKLAKDPKYLGGDIAILAVLHTWTTAMLYHPHVHCLVPAGAITPERNWKESNSKFLVPVKALGKIFAAKVRDAVRKHKLDNGIDQAIWKKPWNVYAKPAIENPEYVIDYLARYLHRVAINNSRIVDIDNSTVTLRGCNREDRKKTTRLATDDFLRRFCLHILPSGFTKVRYYGLWSSPNRKTLHQVQLVLQSTISNSPTSSDGMKKDAVIKEEVPLCPFCRKGFLNLIIRLEPFPKAVRRYSLQNSLRIPRAPPLNAAPS